jgi:hypothetical protein
MPREILYVSKSELSYVGAKKRLDIDLQVLMALKLIWQRKINDKW